MKRLFASTLLVAGSLLSHAEFPTPYNSEKEKDTNPISAKEALEAMNLPEGFNATIYASEPDVANPIAMAWDHKGRMWVAENYTYAERSMRFDMSLRDRVVILNDKDGDGRSDERKVFTDEVQMLTSVEVGKGGVWLMCPPQLLFIPDADGDDVPDGPPEVVLDGFTVAKSNYHNFANGLRWGPDGWLYGRCGHSCPGALGIPGTPENERLVIEGGMWRFHPERKVVEVLTHGTTNPWGHDWDRYGELFFINTVNGHLWHAFPGAHFKESFGADPNPGVYERLDMIADHWHYDRSGRWTESRDGAANDYGGGHAHIGMMIYQAAQWPESLRNRLFTMNMHGLRTNVERLERMGSSYVGKHQDDLFLMGDKWFRGIDVQQGPDGSAYVLDWSDSSECHEHNGVHRTSGRIYRLSHGVPAKSKLEGLELIKAKHVAPFVTDENVWYERQLRSRLQAGAFEANERKEIVKELNRLSGRRQGSMIRLRALWALNALGEVSEGDLLGLLKDDNEHLRVWAIRLLTDQQPLDSIMGPMAHHPAQPLSRKILSRFRSMASKDKSGLVRLALASTLQRLPLDQRVSLGKELVARVEDEHDQQLPSMIWFGLVPVGQESPDALAEVAMKTVAPGTLKWMARNLVSRIESNPSPLNEVLRAFAEDNEEQLGAVLQGVSDGLQGWRKAPMPSAWQAVVRRAEDFKDQSLKAVVRDLSAVFGDGRALDAVKKVVKDRNADFAMRKAALSTLIENRPDDLREICESLLNERHLNTQAVKGLALYNDPAIGVQLAKNYRRFYPPERPSVVEVIMSRVSWATAFLEEMEKGRIPKEDLSAFQARQIRSLKNDALNAKLAKAWGELRDSDAEKRKQIEEWHQKLNQPEMKNADLSRGRFLFKAVCGACHVMYGEGGKIGPDLTGSGRADLGYLIENIVDPSAVVSADYMMTTLKLKDGRTLTGVVASENGKALTLRQATGEETVEKSNVKSREVSSQSMMPEGLMTALQPDMVRDLIGYLQHPSQVPLPKE